MTKVELTCFVCGRATGGMGDTACDVDRAVIFDSGGNFGSQVFDPCDHSRVALAVCDDCFIERKARLVGYRDIERPTERVYFAADIAIDGEPPAPSVEGASEAAATPVLGVEAGAPPPGANGPGPTEGTR